MTQLAVLPPEPARNRKRKTKKPQFDLPTTRGDRLTLLTPRDGVFHRPRPGPKAAAPVIVDLFCGAGGIALGFAEAGFKIALGIDSDALCAETFAYNLRTMALLEDVDQIAEPRMFLQHHGVDRVTGVIGGPPCQGFSRVGKGKMRHLNRLAGGTPVDDARNFLYRGFLRFVDTLRPEFFVLENVPDMECIRDEQGQLTEKLAEEASSLGYRVERRVLHAADFGVPQTRSRLFFVGWRQDTDISVQWPDPGKVRRPYGRVTLRHAIADLPSVPDGHLAREVHYQPCADHWYVRWLRSGMSNGRTEVLFDHITRMHREDDKIVFAMMTEGSYFVDVPELLRRYRCDIFRDKYRKLVWDAPSWTLTAHLKKDSYRYIHPDDRQTRTISVREAARIQSFPDRWRFAGYRSNAFAQVGNAVPPLLARAIARLIARQLKSAGLWSRAEGNDDSGGILSGRG